MDSLATRGITGFTDSAGRDWDVAAYVQVAIRLATSRAHLDARVRSFSAAGTDLVLVVGPSGDATCKKRRPFSEHLLSLDPIRQDSATIANGSGITRTRDVVATLEQAMDEGFLHPRGATRCFRGRTASRCLVPWRHFRTTPPSRKHAGATGRSSWRGAAQRQP